MRENNEMSAGFNRNQRYSKVTSSEVVECFVIGNVV